MSEIVQKISGSEAWLNPAFIGAVVILAVFAALGIKRGLIKTVFHIAGVAVAIILTIFISPYMASFLRNNTDLGDTVHSMIADHVHINFNSSGKDVTEYLDNLNMPQKVEDYLLQGSTATDGIDNTLDGVNNALEGVNNALEGVNDAIVGKLTDMALNCISFIATLILILIILAIVSSLLDLVSKLPLLNSANKALGCIAGLIEGYLVLSVIGVLVMLFSTTAPGIALSTQISANPVLSFIYEHNLLLIGITKVRGLLK